MSDEKYKQEARHYWQEIASIAESVPESASYIHGFIDGMKIGNKELEHKLELAKNEIDKLKYELSCHKIIKKMRKERPFDDE